MKSVTATLDLLLEHTGLKAQFAEEEQTRASREATAAALVEFRGRMKTDLPRLQKRLDEAANARKVAEAALTEARQVEKAAYDARRSFLHSTETGINAAERSLSATAPAALRQEVERCLHTIEQEIERLRVQRPTALHYILRGRHHVVHNRESWEARLNALRIGRRDEVPTWLHQLNPDVPELFRQFWDGLPQLA
jgi:murein L,D-transpeptidase YcbB/YkuD